MKSAYFLFSLLFLQTNSFSINRRSALASMISMTALNPPDSNEDDTSKHLKLVEQNNLPMNIFLGGEQTGELGILQDENNEIYFYGPVSQRSCFELKNKLNSLDAKSSIFHMQYKIDPPPIHLHIQSQGGSLYHTLYIIDLIENMKTPVYTYVDGFAASAATLISVVGKKRYMTKNSLMLIHQLSGADSGKFYELQDQMSNMQILMNTINKIYLNKTKIDQETLLKLLQKDLWLDAETCKSYGLVDEII
jgi:ATP-dependent Clp endopeptidase proteolytic subunit ClpP